MIRTRNLVESVSFYPLSMLYIGASGTLITVSTGTINLAQGMGALALLTVLAMLAANRRELRRVHALVNASHAQLVERNEQLQLLLDASNKQWELLMDTARSLDVHH